MGARRGRQSRSRLEPVFQADGCHERRHGLVRWRLGCRFFARHTVPSLLGQEMGHGFGLAHSRIDGSTADYKDPWDIMSTAGPYEASHPTYTWTGPGMNAANMDGRGWLDGSRVWSGAGTVQLRPLHRRDLPGWLCARVGEFYVEFRVKDGWDKGIPAATVLVHRFEDNRSYLMRCHKWQGQPRRRGRVRTRHEDIPWSDWLQVRVDTSMRAARSRPSRSPTGRLTRRPSWARARSLAESPTTVADGSL